MKRILLASAASIVAFAGAAAAEVTFGGTAELGFNEEVEGGFYYDANVAVTMSQALDNGLTATVTGDFDIGSGSDSDSGVGIDMTAGGYTLTLASEMATLSFGDLDPVGDDIWDGVDGSAVAGFNDQDIHFDDAAEFEAILRGEVMYAGVTAYASFGVDTSPGGNAITGEDFSAMQLAATGSFGAFGFIAAYQEEFGPTPEIIAVAATASVIGADIKLAFETDGDETSYGIGAAYPVGPVTVGGYFTANDLSDDSFGVSADYASGPIAVSAGYDSDVGTDSVFLDASYEIGNGITALAGAGSDLDAETVYYYVAGEVDLGGGASFLMSFADDESAPANDEIGDPEYNQGITALLSFEF